MPFLESLALGSAAAGGITKAIGGISSLFGGGGGSSTGYRLPPELEIQLLRESQRGLKQLDTDYRRINKLQGITERFLTGGGSADEFAQEFEAAQLESIEDVKGLRQLEGQDFKDPVLEGQISDEKARFEADLARAGVGPTGRARALSQFERLAGERRFTRAEELRTGRTERTLKRFGLLGEEARGRASALAQTGLAFGGERRELRGERLGTFETLGSFQFSEPARDSLEAGLVGPGTIKEQTGIARGSVDRFAEEIGKREDILSQRNIDRRVGLTASKPGLLRLRQPRSPSRELPGLYDLRRFS